MAFGSWPIDVKGFGEKSKALSEHVEKHGFMIGISDKADMWSDSVIVVNAIARWCLKSVQPLG